MSRIAVRDDGTPVDVAGWFLEIHRTGFMNLDSFDPVQFPSPADADREDVAEAAVEAFLDRVTTALVEVSTGVAQS